MKTQAQLHRIEAGQALSLSQGSAGPAVLVDGELLVQEPARWLAGLVVLPPSVRFVGPAALPSGQLSVLAVRPSSVLVHEPTPLLSRDRLRAVATWIRGLLGARALANCGRGHPITRP
jgi:hypothetical protein